MKFVKVVIAHSTATAAVLACLAAASWADSRDGSQVEEAECHPMTVANAALAKMSSFQTTWDVVALRNSQREVRHRDYVYENGFLYSRAAPYAAWLSEQFKLPNPLHSDCHRLREEVLDGVKTAESQTKMTFLGLS